MRKKNKKKREKVEISAARFSKKRSTWLRLWRPRHQGDPVGRAGAARGAARVGGGEGAKAADKDGRRGVEEDGEDDQASPKREQKGGLEAEELDGAQGGEDDRH